MPSAPTIENAGNVFSQTYSAPIHCVINAQNFYSAPQRSPEVPDDIAVLAHLANRTLQVEPTEAALHSQISSKESAVKLFVLPGIDDDLPPGFLSLYKLVLVRDVLRRYHLPDSHLLQPGKWNCNKSLRAAVAEFLKAPEDSSEEALHAEIFANRYSLTLVYTLREKGWTEKDSCNFLDWTKCWSQFPRLGAGQAFSIFTSVHMAPSITASPMRELLQELKTAMNEGVSPNLIVLPSLEPLTKEHVSIWATTDIPCRCNNFDLTKLLGLSLKLFKDDEEEKRMLDLLDGLHHALRESWRPN